MEHNSINRKCSIVVSGPSEPLIGVIEPPGSKNSSMPALVAAALNRAEVKLYQVPNLSDIHVLLRILRSLGVDVHLNDGVISISGDVISSESIPNYLSQQLRGSIYSLVLPAVRLGHGYIGQIGGDKLGGRSLEPHARAFSGFGMEFKPAPGGWAVSGGPPRPREFVIDDHGVSATAISILIASAIKGRSIIHDASTELEIEDVINIVRGLGAVVEKDGRTLIVHGPLSEKPASITIPVDQIYCGTMAIAAALTGGDLELPALAYNRMFQVIDALESSGLKVSVTKTLRIQGRPRYPFSIETKMYPGFFTDLLPQMLVLSTQLSGRSFFTERVYHSRFDHVSALITMGARISVDGNKAIVEGPTRLKGFRVQGTGIRETAALLLAGLVAQGQTVIENANSLFRGYEDLARDLSILGAKVCYHWQDNIN